MKTLNKSITVPVALLAAVPMLILGGCAGNDTKNISGDIAFSEAEINKSLTEEELSPGQMGSLVANETDMQGESYLSSPVETAVIESSEAADSFASAEDEMLSAKEILVEPQEKIIGFGFDQSDIDTQYAELLIQHAEYLKENKSLLLKVSGHTDNSGDSTYNQLLSKKRADAVANVLVELGVPEEQIKITASASDEPLVGALSHREHRRVELNYQDQQIVSN